MPKKFQETYLLENKALLPIDLLENVFEYLTSWIRESVRIRHSHHSEAIVDINFDRRFGWIVADETGRKGFLGKLSLATTGKTNLEIGHRTYISGDWLFNGRGSLAIGSYTSIGQDLAIRIARDHPMQYPSMLNFNKEARLVQDGQRIPLEMDEALFGGDFRVSIGNDVWIGRNVEINIDVKIDDGCVIGERSLVLKGTRTEPYGVYAGVPAKKIGSRFSKQVISELLEVKWWDWAEEKIRENHRFFSTDLTQCKLPLKELIL
jgi:acetyltransferase-like isoleucine patch superfamily enzyme